MRRPRRVAGAIFHSPSWFKVEQGECGSSLPLFSLPTGIVDLQSTVPERKKAFPFECCASGFAQKAEKSEYGLFEEGRMAQFTSLLFYKDRSSVSTALETNSNIVLPALQRQKCLQFQKHVRHPQPSLTRPVGRLRDSQSAWRLVRQDRSRLFAVSSCAKETPSLNTPVNRTHFQSLI